MLATGRTTTDSPPGIAPAGTETVTVPAADAGPPDWVNVTVAVLTTVGAANESGVIFAGSPWVQVPGPA